MKILMFFTSILLAFMLLMVSASTCLMTVDYSATAGYTFSLGSTAHTWQNASHPSEDYTFCWIFSKGDYVQTNGLTNPPGTTSITSGYPSAQVLLTTVATNRYGDDDDKKRVAGGSCNPSSPALSFLSFPPTQNLLPAPKLTRIVTDHGSTLAAKNNQLMLILTVNDDSILDDSGSGTCLLTGNNYILRLYHKNTSVGYTYTPGVTETGFPANENEYFVFADTSASAFNYHGLTRIKAWNLTNNFHGHEKNVYCLLNIPNIQLAENQTISDSFVVILTNQGVLVPSSESKTIITIGKSFDPNLISVNKESSMVCGESEEELEYVVHFENTGISDADSVEINLDLDPSLNNRSLMVSDIGIGTHSYLPGGSGDIRQAKLSYSSIGNFEYTVGNSNTNFRRVKSGTVSTDACFLFSGIHLQGINAVNPDESIGYIKFKIKTASPYQSIHNQAGIFFDNNPEIVTNLAETKCMKDSIPADSCQAELAECQKKLRQCSEHDNSWMNWLPWIIAGLEFLILIYLLTRKKK